MSLRQMYIMNIVVSMSLFVMFSFQNCSKVEFKTSSSVVNEKGCALRISAPLQLKTFQVGNFQVVSQPLPQSIGWDFQDGSAKAQGLVVQHMFSTAGTYYVSATGVDNNGEICEGDAPVEVIKDECNPIPTVPVVSLNVPDPISVSQIGVPVVLKASISSDAQIDTSKGVLFSIWEGSNKLYEVQAAYNAQAKDYEASVAFQNPGTYMFRVLFVDKRVCVGTVAKEQLINVECSNLLSAKDIPFELLNPSTNQIMSTIVVGDNKFKVKDPAPFVPDTFNWRFDDSTPDSLNAPSIVVHKYANLKPAGYWVQVSAREMNCNSLVAKSNLICAEGKIKDVNICRDYQCSDLGKQGTYPDCNVCPAGSTGSYPTCACTETTKKYDKATNSCTQKSCADLGQQGVYPDCGVCPVGATGTYPTCACTDTNKKYDKATNSCVQKTCADFGQQGTYPDCNVCPVGATGAYPTCACTDTNKKYDKATNSCVQKTCADLGKQGTYPDCGLCQSGQQGVYPNCGTCPAGSLGSYPDCKCPVDATGAYPNCACNSSDKKYNSTTNKCDNKTCADLGKQGTYPDCNLCPMGSTGVYPSCSCTDSSKKYDKATNSCVQKTCVDLGLDGVYPDCNKCPVGANGTYPSCSCSDSSKKYDKATNSCVQKTCADLGLDGVYPDCNKCPTGATGSYPSCSCTNTNYKYNKVTNTCVQKTCADLGLNGIYPDCGVCPANATGVYPSCSCAGGIYDKISNSCQCGAGQSGIYPNCLSYSTQDIGVSTSIKNPKLTLYMIVDNSNSMSQNQQVFSQGVSSMLSNLRGYDIDVKLLTTTVAYESYMSVIKANYTDSSGQAKSVDFLFPYLGDQLFGAARNYAEGTAKTFSTVSNFNHGNLGDRSFSSQMSDVEFSNSLNILNSNIVMLGTSGSDHEDALCSLGYRLSDMQQPTSGEKAAVVILSDENRDANFLDYVYGYNLGQPNSIVTVPVGHLECGLKKAVHAKNYVVNKTHQNGSAQYFADFTYNPGNYEFVSSIKYQFTGIYSEQKSTRDGVETTVCYCQRDINSNILEQLGTGNQCGDVARQNCEVLKDQYTGESGGANQARVDAQKMICDGISHTCAPEFLSWQFGDTYLAKMKNLTCSYTCKVPTLQTWTNAMYTDNSTAYATNDFCQNFVSGNPFYDQYRAYSRDGVISLVSGSCKKSSFEPQDNFYWSDQSDYTKLDSQTQSLKQYLGASESDDIKQVIKQKLSSMYGADGYFVSTIIHNQFPDLDCTGSTVGSAGDEYLNFADNATSGNKMLQGNTSICKPNYVDALKPMGSWAQTVLGTTYALDTSKGSVYKVEIYSGTTLVKTLIAGTDYTVDYFAKTITFTASAGLQKGYTIRITFQK